MNPMQHTFPGLQIANVLHHGPSPGLGGEEEGEGGRQHQAAEDRDRQPGVNLAAKVHYKRRQSRSQLRKNGGRFNPVLSSTGIKSTSDQIWPQVVGTLFPLLLTTTAWLCQ